MKIIYNNIIPFRGFAAMMFFGIIFARKSAKPLSLNTINHEKIHHAQARECGGYLWYYSLYLCQWTKYGYRNSPFEREAYENAANLSYLKQRQAFAWKKYDTK
jgi:hypothetical protein